ncbi:hypothetical protein [Natronobeatus ordinarius]|uniref:hypothetical protein n=1 Tax=Natronobeatus ordinarius TaxID=2963433 RepID=UPI0020CF58F4|nr:hypothetical protein [Natronobeatus ordinarius]
MQFGKGTSIKISLIISLTSVSISYLLKGLKVDDFSPKHIEQSYLTARDGTLTSSIYVDQIPGFYTTGAVFLEILGLDAVGLLFVPIHLFPYSVLFFAIIYKISNSMILSSVLLSAQLISGSSGSGELTLWPHAYGFMLLLSIAIILLIVTRQGGYKARHLLLISLLSVSLVFISYNRLFMTMILLVGYWFFVRHSDIIYRSNNKSGNQLTGFFMTAIIVPSVVLLGLHTFLYNVFLPMITGPSATDLTSLDRFLNRWVGEGRGVSPLEPLLVSQSEIHLYIT